MGKVDIRHRKLLSLLRENGTMTRTEICSLLNIRESTLSEDLRLLKNHGIQFDTPPRSGKITLIPDPASHLPDKRLKNSDIRFWMLLFILRDRPLTFPEIETAFAQITDGVLDAQELQAKRDRNEPLRVSADTLHQYLKDLADEGFIRKLPTGNNKYVYEHTLKSSIMCTLTDDQAYDFMEICTLLENEHPLPVEMSDILQKMSVLSGYEKNGGNESRTVSAFGKMNILSPRTKKNLYMLAQLPYKEKKIRVEFLNKAGHPASFDAACGLLFYSQETGLLYILAKVDPELCFNDDLAIISVEKIISVSALDEPNRHFHSGEIMQIYHEMFSADNNSREHVRIRFENKTYIRDKLRILTENRSATSSLTLDPETDTLVYEDTIRGLTAFRHYLRFFSPGYTIEEPESLKKEMADSARNIVNLYKERFKNA